MARPRKLPDPDWLFSYLQKHLEGFDVQIARYIANVQLPRGKDKVTERLHQFATEMALTLDDEDYKRLKVAWRQRCWRRRESEKRLEYLENRMSEMQFKQRLKDRTQLGSWH